MSLDYLGYFVGAFIAAGFVALVLWIMTALGCFWIAKSEGKSNAWLAFIPVLCFYLWAELIDESGVLGMKIPNLKIILPIASIVVGLVSAIPIIGLVLTLIYYIFMILVQTEIFKKQLSLPVSLLLAIFLPFVGFFVCGMKSNG